MRKLKYTSAVLSLSHKIEQRKHATLAENEWRNVMKEGRNVNIVVTTA